MNLCRACNFDFASVDAFDRHRIGRHDYTLSEGLKMEPPREDGRRCLAVDEFSDAGMEFDSRGRWRLAKAAERIAAVFSTGSVSLGERAGAPAGLRVSTCKGES